MPSSLTGHQSFVDALRRSVLEAPGETDPGLRERVAGMRLPDAARVALYPKNFFGKPMGAWTQAAMRGPSVWRVGERELMAAMVAKWNSCPFCIGAHAASQQTSWSDRWSIP